MILYAGEEFGAGFFRGETTRFFRMGNDRLRGSIEDFLTGDFQRDIHVLTEADDVGSIHIALIVSGQDDGARISLPILGQRADVLGELFIGSAGDLDVLVHAPHEDVSHRHSTQVKTHNEGFHFPRRLGVGELQRDD